MKLLALAGLVLWYQHVPDASGRFDAMEIDAEAGLIELDGTWRPADLVTIRNRSQDGASGCHVAAPLAAGTAKDGLDFEKYAIPGPLLELLVKAKEQEADGKGDDNAV